MPQEKEPLIRREIINAARSGDTLAFSEIYSVYHPPLVNFLTRRFRNPQLAEDMANETFIKALEAISATSDDLKIGKWLTTIAINTTLNFLRGESRRVMTESRSSSPDRFVTRSAEAEALDRIAIEEAYKTFDPHKPDQVHFRDSLFLNAAGFKYQEISKIHTTETAPVVPTTVGTRISRARKILKAAA